MVGRTAEETEARFNEVLQQGKTATEVISGKSHCRVHLIHLLSQQIATV